LTLQQTGERIGVSRERVRQIENQAKARMRKLFDKKRRIHRFARSPQPAVEAHSWSVSR